MRVAYLGPEGTFSNAAAKKIFPKAVLVPESSIESIFESLNEKKAEYGVVPIENSLEGGVYSTLDALMQKKVPIQAQYEMRIRLVLAGLSGTKIGGIQKVYSHQHAFSQVRRFLSEKVRGAQQIETSSTAAACEHVSSKREAAVCSAEAARKKGLRALARDIGEHRHNTTRFLVVGFKELMPKEKNMRTSIAFTLANKPGALFNALKGFAKNKVNLTKIESRPTRQKKWEYVFFVDFDGKPKEKNAEAALGVLEKNAGWLRVLGTYPKL